MKHRLWLPMLVILLDQLTKAWARGLTERVILIPGVVGLTYVQNTGIAFSMLSGMPWLLGILSVAVVIVGWRMLRPYRLKGWAAWAAMLMLGGALGNAIDRLFLGSVTDMVEVLCFQFAVFNLADAALCVGCGMMAISLLFLPKEWERKDRS